MLKANGFSAFFALSQDVCPTIFCILPNFFQLHTEGLHAGREDGIVYFDENICSHKEDRGLEKRFLLVDAEVLPEVFQKVLKAKELLASGEVKNISAATRAADISRSAFYKYKDCIFDAENSREILTVIATLRDQTGALQALLAGISAAGASIVTINQSTPENGAAQVAVAIRTGTMQMSVDEMLAMLARQRTVVEIHRGI